MSSEETNENGIQRIEAFSDGVFAIAITLLILEIKVPHTRAETLVADLGASLRALWPSYFAYVSSFVIVGIYWANHHYLFKFFRRTDHVFNLLNVLFLMCISFVPLPTAVLAEYFHDKHNYVSAVAFYVIGFLLPATAWLFFWLYGSSRYRLIDEDLDERFVASLTRQYLIAPAVYLAALAATFVNPNLGLVIGVGLTALYLLPPKPPVYRTKNEPAPMTATGSDSIPSVPMPQKPTAAPAEKTP